MSTSSARLGVDVSLLAVTICAGTATEGFNAASGLLCCVDEKFLCGDIHVVKEVPKSTGSHHFKVLREAGLIRMVPQGRRVLVSLRRADLEERFPGLLDAILHTYDRQ